MSFLSSSLVKSFKYINYFKNNKFVSFLDIGLDRTTLILFDQQRFDSLNSIPIGGNHISKDISQIMKLDLEESEKLKKISIFLSDFHNNEELLEYFDLFNANLSKKTLNSYLKSVSNP